MILRCILSDREFKVFTAMADRLDIEGRDRYRIGDKRYKQICYYSSSKNISIYFTGTTKTLYETESTFIDILKAIVKDKQ